MYSNYMQQQFSSDENAPTEAAPAPQPAEASIPVSAPSPPAPLPSMQSFGQTNILTSLPHFTSGGLFAQLPNALSSHHGTGFNLGQLFEGDNWIILAALFFLLDEDGAIDLDLVIIAGILLLLGF